jgi:rhamnose utilization protein RhaD (predicted bifunctional aldolase and dehydrogenase)
MNKADALARLVEMSRELGEPTNDYVILGEGNTSARLSEQTFAVKASGTTLRGIQPEHFVEVRFDAVLELLDRESATDAEVKDALQAACADPASKLRPSVETVLHASLLSLPGIGFVGHTHPTAVNMILCSRNWKDVLAGRIFPDEIVSCGVAPVLVDYTDPGLPLAKVVHRKVREFLEAAGEPPKAVLMQNHGLIAIGQTPVEVLGITAMWVKTARVLRGTFAFGGPRFFSEQEVARISTRPDELYRMKLIRGLAG